MKKITFTKTTRLMDRYIFEAEATYEVPDRLALKYCSQVGCAFEADGDADAQANPAAELFAGEDLAPIEVAPVKADVPPETEPEVTPEVEVGTFELKSRGKGPWFDVINVATGEQVNKKPMRKSDAEALLLDLSSGDVDSSPEE